ncbi:MAG: hypothetical protein JNN27_14720 [Planctomycetes bacterium]|nr:hypothetical protein [Planctomycetota bacterium]
MNTIRFIAFAALLPLSLSAAKPGIAMNDDDVVLAPCTGCEFHNAPGAAGGIGLNPCNSEIRVSVFGMSGRCVRENAGAACTPGADCLSVRVTEVRSDCAMRLEDSDGRSWGFQPTGGWILADAMVLWMPCDSAQAGLYELTDQTGHVEAFGYMYWCSKCSG